VKKYAIIILAAGTSRRMGKPKQLLPYEGKNLLEHAVQVAKDSKVGKVILVLGANHEMIVKDMQPDPIDVCINPDWEQGVSTSIFHGLNTLLEIDSEWNGVIIMTGDQPFVNADLLQELVLTHEQTNKSIVASKYQETIGSPAFFQSAFFTQLLELKGDVGARKIIQSNGSQLVSVAFAKGEIDIDTPEDYDKLLKSVIKK
jgi:molybdenum cofactor cytidylyltransferase